VDILLLVALGLGVATAGVTQVVAGTGVRLIIPPLAILALGHAEGLRVAMTLGLLISLVTFLGDRAAVPFRRFVPLALPVVISAPLWVLLVDLIPEAVAARLAGLAAVAAVVVTLRAVRTGHLAGRFGALGAGAAASGVFALGGVGGPVLGMYARDNGWAARPARGVVNACIALAQVRVLAFMGLPTATEPGLAVGLGGLAVGLVLGGVIAAKLPKVNAKLARGVSLVVAGIAAVVLLVAGAQV
jgi:hypothetical protein